jgi:hypothetical protein
VALSAGGLKGSAPATVRGCCLCRSAPYLRCAILVLSRTLPQDLLKEKVKAVFQRVPCFQNPLHDVFEGKGCNGCVAIQYTAAPNFNLASLPVTYTHAAHKLVALACRFRQGDDVLDTNRGAYMHAKSIAGCQGECTAQIAVWNLNFNR